MGFKFNPITGQFDISGVSGSLRWRDPVSNYAALPLTGNTLGDAIVTLDSSTIYIWNGTTWVSSSPNQYKVEKFTLMNGDIINKYVTLASVPTTPSLVRVIFIGGIEQDYGTDFVVIGNQVNWDNLGLENIVEINDKIIVVYN